MHAPDDNSALARLRRWWLAPPRPGMQRLINPWEYRHLRVFGGLRMAGGGVAVACAILTLSFGGADPKTYGWVSFFLVIAALNIAGGWWYLTVAHTTPPRA